MPRKETAFAVGATALVIAGLVLGFWQLGGRPRQRDLRADDVRLDHFVAIAGAIHNKWTASAVDESRKLPATLEEFRATNNAIRTADPITGVPYEYIPGAGPQYELCAVFATASTDTNIRRGWTHPKGRHCFSMNAAVEPRMRGLD